LQNISQQARIAELEQEVEQLKLKLSKCKASEATIAVTAQKNKIQKLKMQLVTAGKNKKQKGAINKKIKVAFTRQQDLAAKAVAALKIQGKKVGAQVAKMLSGARKSKFSGARLAVAKASIAKKKAELRKIEAAAAATKVTVLASKEQNAKGSQKKKLKKAIAAAQKAAAAAARAVKKAVKNIPARVKRAVADWHGKCCDLDGSLSVIDKCEHACKSSDQLAGVMRLQSELILGRKIRLFNEMKIHQQKDIVARWVALGFEIKYDADDMEAKLNNVDKPLFDNMCCDEVGLFTDLKGCQNMCTSSAHLGEIIAKQSEFVSNM
jgi:hypothetical protein